MRYKNNQFFLRALDTTEHVLLKESPHTEHMLATQEVRRIMGMVFKDPPSSVTTYRRLHIQSIIKVTLHSPDSELSPCVLAYLLVCSGHCACDVKRGQV